MSSGRRRVPGATVAKGGELVSRLTAPPRPALPKRARQGAVARTDAAPTYHFTCEHHVFDIVAVGAVIPHRHPFMPMMAPMAWFTTLAHPSADDVGLTSTILSCNRLAHRFQVLDHSTLIPWSYVVEHAPPSVLPRWVIADLGRYGKPDTWLVSTTPVEVMVA
jgi:hypothetical protein